MTEIKCVNRQLNPSSRLDVRRISFRNPSTSSGRQNRQKRIRQAAGPATDADTGAAGAPPQVRILLFQPPTAQAMADFGQEPRPEKIRKTTKNQHSIR